MARGRPPARSHHAGERDEQRGPAGVVGVQERPQQNRVVDAVQQPRNHEVAGVLVDGAEDDAGHEEEGQRHRDPGGAAGDGDDVDDREDGRGQGDGGRGREAFPEPVLDDAAGEELLEYCSNFACSFPTITHTMTLTTISTISAR